MTKDNQGKARKPRPKRAGAKDDRKAESQAFTGTMEAVIAASPSARSKLLPISRAFMDTMQKARLAREAGQPMDFQQFVVITTAQRVQITLAEPESPVDAMVMASCAMRLADVLLDLDEEGLKLASIEILCALGGIRRFHERQAGITSEALGLNGPGPVLQ